MPTWDSMGLSPVKMMSDVGGLCKLNNDCIKFSIRKLNALDIKAEAYGALLIPLTNEKLPDEPPMIGNRTEI